MRLNRTKIITLLVVITSAQSIWAMNPISDEYLADVVGQDGITMQILSDAITLDKLLLHDNDGLQPIVGQTHGITAPQAGAIILNEVSIRVVDPSKPLLKLILDSDGGMAFDGSEATLNIQIEVADTEIGVDSIAVGTSGTPDSTNARRGTTHEIKIIDDFVISLGALTFNTQLGHQSQGALARVYGTIENGVRVSKMGILSGTNQTYAFGMKDIVVKDNGVGNNDLTFSGLAVDIDQNAGIIIRPSVGKLIDVSMNEFSFGGNALGPSNSIGSVSISGIALGGQVISIIGH